MSWFTRSAVAGGLLVALAGASANAGLFNQNIYLTFSDPVGQREVRYTQPADGTQQGSLTYNTAVPVVLSFDLSDFGIGAPVLISSSLELDVTVGSASPGSQANEFLATTFGEFTYRDAGTNELLLSGSFSDASLSVLRTSGGLTANGQMQTVQFSVTFHGALLTEFANAGYMHAGIDENRVGDASWTLTGVSPTISLVTPQGSAEQFFASFNSNAAFTATIPVVPTPGAVSLALAAGFVAFGIRRR